MSAEDCSADLESVDSLSECVDAMAGYEGFTEFAHCHEDDGHFLWRLLRRLRCIERCWCGTCGRRVHVEVVKGGFEGLTAGMGSAEFHVAGDYAFEVCLLCLEICQSNILCQFLSHGQVQR